MEKISQISPRLEGWQKYRPNRVTEDLIEKLTNTYAGIAPSSKDDEVDHIVIERNLATLLENRNLQRETNSDDNYTWALSADFAVCPALPGTSRIKILFPYKNTENKKLDRPLAVYVNGEIWQRYIGVLFRKITTKLNELKFFV